MVVNTMALTRVGYGKASPQPEGGEIEKDSSSTISPNQIKDIIVLATIIAGNIVYGIL
jgi:predicted amidohydrolase YtcJ